MSIVTKHKDLKVFQVSFETALMIYGESKTFPGEEKYSLTDQIRRSSRSVSANIAEAWRKRKYPKSFIAKLSDAEAEAAETQVWLDFCLALGFISNDTFEILFDKYEHIIAMLINMSNKAEQWKI